MARWCPRFQPTPPPLHPAPPLRRLSSQIPECLAAPTPDDCPEKRAGSFCSPIRSGIFPVVGKDIVLHVGSDVKNALSCMIQVCF